MSLQADDGSRCDFRWLADGTSCAGGACQFGACQVTRLDIPCTRQGYANALYAGCGPYTFDCDRPTVIPVGDLAFTKDVILDGGGNLIIERGLVADGASVELRRFVIVTNRITTSGGNLRVVNTTVKNDGEDAGGFLSMGRGALALTLTGCTVLSSEEIEIVSDDGVVLVANSTLSFGSEGGSISSVSGESEVTVTNSTLRSRGVFPVIAVAGDAPPATVTATIVDGECLGLIDSDGYNIESPGNTCDFDQEGDQPSVPDPMLGPLQDNGGPTETHALLPGSVAIDVIPADMCEVGTDQRGVDRPQGTMCDVGAFELEQ